jgi:hypothetical protein
METITISSAQVIFAAGGVLITISLVILKYAWGQLELMINSLPIGDKVIFRDLKLIEDERQKIKAITIIMQFLGALCFPLVISFSLFAMLGVLSVMVGFQFGYYTVENYMFSQIFILIAFLFLLLGFVLLGYSSLDKVISVAMGKQELTTTQLGNFPPADPAKMEILKRLEKRGISLFYIYMFCIVFVEIFNLVVWERVLIDVGLLLILFMVFTRTPANSNKDSKQDKKLHKSS